MSRPPRPSRSTTVSTACSTAGAAARTAAGTEASCRLIRSTSSDVVRRSYSVPAPSLKCAECTRSTIEWSIPFFSIAGTQWYCQASVAAIELQGVTKVFPNGFAAVRAVDLRIADGEFLVLVGPSGCGKTTLLRLLAGLEEVTAGRVTIGDGDVTDAAPRQRDIAMVFQNYALYPHMSVRQNLGYGLKVRRTPKAEARRRVEEVAAMLGLEALLDRRPAQLSGGQRQRVAMGRAIVREPKAFLMDEPLSNLDAK